MTDYTFILSTFKALTMFANVFISFQGIFISRVIKGGASEKAGIHVGDRLLEVGDG